MAFTRSDFSLIDEEDIHIETEWAVKAGFIRRDEVRKYRSELGYCYRLTK